MKRTEEITSKQTAKHPGEILLNEFMRPFGLTGNRLSLALHVSSQRISQILNGRRAITAESALRLSRLFGTTAKYWLDLQAEYELSQAEEKWAQVIDLDIRPLRAAKSAKQEKGKKQNRPSAALKLTGNEKKVYAQLSDDLIDFDNLCYKSGLNAGELSAAITMLELSDLVQVHFDRFKKSR